MLFGKRISPPRRPVKHYMYFETKLLLSPYQRSRGFCVEERAQNALSDYIQKGKTRTSANKNAHSSTNSHCTQPILINFCAMPSRRGVVYDNYPLFCPKDTPRRMTVPPVPVCYSTTERRQQHKKPPLAVIINVCTLGAPYFFAAVVFVVVVIVVVAHLRNYA